MMTVREETMALRSDEDRRGVVSVLQAGCFVENLDVFEWDVFLGIVMGNRRGKGVYRPDFCFVPVASVALPFQ